MSEFWAYLQLGFSHITDLNGFDHILFIVALCAVYELRQWKSVLILVTAFTVGHSVTLALATMNVFAYRTDVIEFLIPVTILITAISNFFYREQANPLAQPRAAYGRYWLAAGFGLIHGMGFSTFLRSLLGKESSIVAPLLAFNIGLEIGQILIVLIFLTIATVLHAGARLPRHDWNLITSGIVAGMALMLMLESELVSQ